VVAFLDALPDDDDDEVATHPWIVACPRRTLCPCSTRRAMAE
jgi:hypothetical protein